MTNRLSRLGEFRIEHDLRGTAEKHHQFQKLPARPEISAMVRHQIRPDKTKLTQAIGQRFRFSGLPPRINGVQKQRWHQNALCLD